MKWKQPTSCRRHPCHFWAWGFRCAKTPGNRNSRHPAGHPCGSPLAELPRSPRRLLSAGSRHPCRQGLRRIPAVPHLFWLGLEAGGPESTPDRLHSPAAPPPPRRCLPGIRRGG
jgi:hypothetical protein